MAGAMFSSLSSVFFDFSPYTAVFVVVVFFFAGVIKGLVGFGMPLFAISVLATIMPLTTAIAANVGPSLITNIRQALRGPYFLVLLRRLWPFLVPAIGLIWVGVGIQVRIDPAYPGLMLGVLAVLFALVSFLGLQPRLAPHLEKPVGACVGVVNGLITGVTGIFIIPGGLFLQSLGLKRDELVQALGLLFMMSTATIGLVFSFSALMTPSLVVLSIMAIPTALTGMRIGEKLRARLSEELFRTLFLAGIGVIGGSLIVRNLLTLMSAQ